MKRHTPTGIALALALGIAAGSASASTNLVVNGSFEDISASTGI